MNSEPPMAAATIAAIARTRIQRGAELVRGPLGLTTTVAAILSCQPCLRGSNAAQMKPMSRIRLRRG